MYTPPAFRQDSLEVLHAFLRRYSFATLVTASEGAIVANPFPFLLDASAGPKGTLLGHMARGNPQWRSFAKPEPDALVIFQGPHAYITPSWYEPASDNVPTWNYTAVHAYGKPAVIADFDRCRAFLRELVQVHEAPLDKPWQLSLSEQDWEDFLAAIVVFEIPVTRLEGKFKLSQNQTPSNQANVRSRLTHAEDPHLRELAAFLPAPP